MSKPEPDPKNQQEQHDPLVGEMCACGTYTGIVTGRRHANGSWGVLWVFDARKRNPAKMPMFYFHQLDYVSVWVNRYRDMNAQKQLSRQQKRKQE